MRKILSSLMLSACLGSLTISIQPVFAQGTAFTYQGRLQNNGSPANGNYDFTFALFNTNSTNAGQVGSVLTDTNIGVTNGLFIVTLDFGAVFTGNATWLAIGVRTNGGSGFTALNPLQELTPTPYATYAPNAGAAASANSVAATNIIGAIPITQLPPGILTNGEHGVNITGAFTGNGAGLTNLPALAGDARIMGSYIYSGNLPINTPQLLFTNTGPCTLNYLRAYWSFTDGVADPAELSYAQNAILTFYTDQQLRGTVRYDSFFCNWNAAYGTQGARMTSSQTGNYEADGRMDEINCFSNAAIYITANSESTNAIAFAFQTYFKSGTPVCFTQRNHWHVLDQTNSFTGILTNTLFSGTAGELELWMYNEQDSHAGSVLTVENSHPQYWLDGTLIDSTGTSDHMGSGWNFANAWNDYNNESGGGYAYSPANLTPVSWSRFLPVPPNIEGFTSWRWYPCVGSDNLFPRFTATNSITFSLVNATGVTANANNCWTYWTQN